VFYILGTSSKGSDFVKYLCNCSAGSPSQSREPMPPSLRKPARGRFCRIQAKHPQSHPLIILSCHPLCVRCVWHSGQCEFSVYLEDCSRKTHLPSRPPILFTIFVHLCKILEWPWCLFFPPCLYLIKMNWLLFEMLSGLASLFFVCVFLMFYYLYPMGLLRCRFLRKRPYSDQPSSPQGVEVDLEPQQSPGFATATRGGCLHCTGQKLV
jgi:hypothetical protein